MLQDFYTAASGMFMQQRVLNTIANNTANVQTPGYKRKSLISSTFEQTLLTRLESGSFTRIGTGAPVRIVSEVNHLYEQGGLTQTGSPFNMAISGPGFFNIQGEDGETYLTRDGQFTLDEEGYLILRGRGRLLGTGGPLRPNTSDFTVSETGAVTDNRTGAAIGQLQITIPAEGAEMLEVRTGMYQLDGAAQVMPAGEFAVVQGAIEESTAKLTDEMTAAIVAQRNFAMASQALQFIDGTYAKATTIAAI